VQITRSSETVRGRADWFTGTVFIDAIAAAPALGAAAVHFTPGARTAIEVIRPGDRVFFEPGENHWHGAAPARFMTHVAMQLADENGSAVTWGEHVTDEQYGRAPDVAA
jgi:hypothetical protein